ncbi:MAG: hypothetical protein D3918_07465 [Candidatus Electrothrix sp. AX2]|nr:hypothetical protein [Candidatus Electrothrix gigas]
MKSLASITVVIVILCVAFIAEAAPPKVEYGYFDARKADWRAKANSFINSHKPKPGNISGGISGKYDLHIWLIAGNFNGQYELLHYNSGKNPEWRKAVKTAVRGGAMVLGFSGPDIWLVNIQ